MAYGNTTTICLTAFRSDWMENIPLAAICERWSVSKDQVTRLRVRWELPPRTSRQDRYKPEAVADPTEREIELRAAEIRATWNEDTESKRRIGKQKAAGPRVIPLSAEALEAMYLLGDPEE